MKWVIGIVAFLCVVWGTAYIVTTPLLTTYESFSTNTVIDRNGVPIFIEENSSGQYFLPFTNYPTQLKKIVLTKEDKYFYFHPGFNPLSLLRTTLSGVQTKEYGGSSTITQQLVKILLGNVTDRTVRNKLKESLLAVALEIRLSKDEILTMYLNSVALGNQAQGFAQASLVYYDTPITELSEIDLVSLAASLSSPSTANPWQPENNQYTQNLANKLQLSERTPTATTSGYRFNSPTYFEVASLIPSSCASVCKTSIDSNLTEKVRGLVKNHTDLTAAQGGSEAAVVIIEQPSNKLITIIGSPQPHSQHDGSQINMAIQPRPVGSTIKPFIYGAAFERDVRPYTLLDDREYKYEIGTGFPLYPINYDGTYEGMVTVQSSLANSLNTPSIKLLEFVTLPEFYRLLSEKMAFEPINSLSSYSYGIALGGLEMDLLTLSHYFTSLAQRGTLQPISIIEDEYLQSPQNSITEPVQLFDPPTVELLTGILTNREAGVEQFGIRSTLDVFGKNVAVKTGTSRNFHDSWAIGYTSDYVVGVWIGNAKNEPMDNLSGAAGAGTLWRQIVELVETTEYSKDTPFTYTETEQRMIQNVQYRTHAGDDIAYHTNLLLDHSLILLPHDNDSFLYTKDTAIEFSASDRATWSVDEQAVVTTQSFFWTPPAPGSYMISAATKDQTETITIDVVAEATPLLQ